jgi:DNA-binding transcriptional ArsR family regulator
VTATVKPSVSPPTPLTEAEREQARALAWTLEQLVRPSCIEVCEVLRRAGRTTAEEIHAALVPRRLATITLALTVLADAGLVEQEQDTEVGRDNHLYRLSARGTGLLADYYLALHEAARRADPEGEGRMTDDRGG